jgi:L-ascorbate metabolism protein UlaG (beta-lactamase superfamily)
VTARLTWLGHSTALVELGGERLLTDPALRGRVFHLRRHGQAPGPPESIDAVLLSHIHFDHLDLPSLRMLEPRPRLVCPTGSGALLASAGFHDPIELLPDESVALGDVRVTATRADHRGTRRPGGPVVRPLGFVLRAERSIYFAGDTDLFDEMAGVGPVDVALLPVAGYSPKLGPGHLDAHRAAQAAALIRPRVAVPIHWGTFHPLTQARGDWFTRPPAEFAAQVAELAPDVDVRVLAPGEAIDL